MQFSFPKKAVVFSEADLSCQASIYTTTHLSAVGLQRGNLRRPRKARWPKKLEANVIIALLSI